MNAQTLATALASLAIAPSVLFPAALAVTDRISQHLEHQACMVEQAADPYTATNAASICSDRRKL